MVMSMTVLAFLAMASALVVFGAATVIRELDFRLPALIQTGNSSLRPQSVNWLGGDRFVRCGFDLLRSALTHTESCGADWGGIRTRGWDASLTGSFHLPVTRLMLQADLGFALILHRSFPFVIQFRQRLAGQFFP